MCTSARDGFLERVSEYNVFVIVREHVRIDLNVSCMSKTLPQNVLIMGVAICRAALHIGVVHSLICRAGMNQSKRLVLVT